MAESIDSKLQIVMFPWLALGHIIPFLNLSNELAKKGHKISFLLPKNAQIKLQNLNLYPNLITFHTLKIPHVHGLPYGAETTADVPRSLESLLATAMDELYDEIKSFLQNLKPHFVFFDFAHWVTEIALEIGGVKTICYKLASPATSAISLIRSPEKSVFLASTAAEKQPVLYTRPFLPEPEKRHLEEHQLSSWLEKFEPGSVVFCTFGSQLKLVKRQF
ncbi:hypothetical protein KY285_019631 [Solanum tuberosum]|nr:hypothetical protein KY285_019631 [Solanum tuberosum]